MKVQIILSSGVLATALVSGWAETNQPRFNFWTQGKPGQLPTGFEATLVADKTNFFLGENILLQYRIHTGDSNSFQISVGGDYRGSTRSDRFLVTAVGVDGRAVADPTPFMQNFGGGMMPAGEIKPGQDWFEKVWVVEYCRFDAPGSYTVSVFHDLGFGERMASDPREATLTIHLRAPSEAEAEAILVEAENAKPYHGSTWGKKGEARLDYQCIRWPTFLRPLQRRAWMGREDALEGISGIRNLEATTALVDLLGHTNLAFATKAAKALEVRLPHPASYFSGPWGERRRQFIIEGAWDEALGQPVREFSVRLLAQMNRGDLLTASALLRLIGTTNELKALHRALEFAVAQITPEFLADVHYPAPIRVCDAIAGAMLGLDVKLSDKLDPNKSPGNLLLYLSQHGGTNGVLSDTDVKYFARGMQHRFPYLRMKALENLPNKIPEALNDSITRCMTDANVGVQNYAFLAAQRMQIPKHRDIALAVLKTAEDQWLRGNAEQIAIKYGSRYECALAWCAHLIAPKDINDYTTHDALRHLLQLTTGRLSGGGFNPRLTKESARDLRLRWEAFLTDNKEAIKAGHLFAEGETGVPSELLPPGWSLNAR